MSEPMSDEMLAEIKRSNANMQREPTFGGLKREWMSYHDELIVEVEQMKLYILSSPSWELYREMQNEVNRMIDAYTKKDSEVEQLRKVEEECVPVEELAHKHNALYDAIDLAEEGIGYTSEYFRDKWGMDKELARLKGLLQ